VARDVLEEVLQDGTDEGEVRGRCIRWEEPQIHGSTRGVIGGSVGSKSDGGGGAPIGWNGQEAKGGGAQGGWCARQAWEEKGKEEGSGGNGWLAS
jgi:hypothetical protein